MRLTRFAPVLLWILPVASAACAQAPAPNASVATLPNVPAAVAYRYWPRMFFQWVGPELPYSMMELDVDDRGAQPIYDVVMTDRAGEKRVHYVNQPGELALDKAMGAEVHLVPMRFDAPAEAANGATYLLRFTTETGVPVSWQFVQGSDVSDQGSGVTPIEGPRPTLLVREQGAVAGEGTALKVGNVTSVADMWKEISHPPYFVAYHGAISQDVHVIAFLARTSDWKVEPASAAVAAAAEWKLTTAEGRELAVHVDSLKDGLATLHATSPLVGTSITLEARQTPTGWALERVRYAPSAPKTEHTVTFSFTPALGGEGTSKFELVAGKKKPVASGTVTASAGGKEAWTLSKPNLTPKAPVEASASMTR